MARIFLDEMGGINQGMLGAYGLPISPFSTEDYVAPVTETQVRPTRTRRKQSKPKPKRNDGIIRNHDSVWDYKIQNGRLLTRRKTSDGNWVDITNNDEARQKIEQFTGRSIGNKQSASNNSQTSKPASTSKPSNSSQAQPSRPASTAQTQQTARPATPQPAKQQAVQQRPVARQDSTRRDTSVAVQPRSLANTRGSNTEPDWQNMTEAEVDAWFANHSYNLPGITVTGKWENSKPKPTLSQKDLDKMGWHFSEVLPGSTDVRSENYFTLPLHYGDSDAERDPNIAHKQVLYDNALDRGRNGESILLDDKNRPVSQADVKNYIARGRTNKVMSDYDAQFYQPQSENSTLKDVRQAQDVRRNQAFDRQRNVGLGVMAGLPFLVGGLATAPAATLLGLGGSALVGAGFEGAWKHATGNSWAQSLGATDANSGFYADMLQPGRAIGGLLGGIAGNMVQKSAQEALSPIYNKAISYLYNRFANPGIPYKNVPYPSLAATEETAGTKALADAMNLALSGKQQVKPNAVKQQNGRQLNLKTAEARTKAYWEERQPYQVKVKKDAQGRLYPVFNTKRINTSFRGYPSYNSPEQMNESANLLETILQNYTRDFSQGNTISHNDIQALKTNIDMLYGLPYGYWQGARLAPGYVNGPRYGSIVIGE